MAAVGEGLGVLLENSMLHEESETANQTQRRMAVENAVMADIGRIISSSLDIHDVYEAFVAELAKLIGFEWVSVNLVDLKDQTVTVTYASRELIGHKSFPLVGTFTWAAASEPTGLVVDFSRGEDHPELGPFSEAGYRSIMGVRLVHHQVISQSWHIRRPRTGHRRAGCPSNCGGYRQRRAICAAEGSRRGNSEPSKISFGKSEPRRPNFRRRDNLVRQRCRHKNLGEPWLKCR